MSDNPGFRFKDNKLYAFSEGGVMILEAWPTLKAIRKEGDDEWEEFDPRFRVVKPYRPQKAKRVPQLELAFDHIPIKPTLSDQRRRAFDGFRFSMPKPAAAAVEKFQNRQWGILRLVRLSEGAIELARLNPALAFALGNFKPFREKFTTMEGAAAISKRRQRDIAEALGFPGTEAAAKILAKISAESVAVDILLQLREALRRDVTLKPLSHMKKLNAGVLALATNPSLLESSTPALLAEVAESATEKYQARAAEMLSDTLEMLAAIDPSAGRPKIQSLARLHAMHTEVSMKFLTLRPGGSVGTKLPSPPLRGTRDITPILTSAALVAEGEEQNNCVAAYAERVRRRTTFIYRVLRPERATLSIVKGEDGDWRIDELEARGNTRVSAITRQAVESWLDQFALSV
jgi:hypothetical protein